MVKRLIRDFNEVFLDVYLIGYPTEGESIVCCLRTENDTSPFLFTCVIDCYCNEQQANYTIKLLKKLEIQKLDLLCWTHPDADHSLGIDELIFKYVDKGTMVSIPISLLEHKEDFNKSSQQYCQMILNRLKTRKVEDKIQLKYTGNDTEVYARDYLKINQDKSYGLRIKALAPDSSLVANLLNRRTMENNIFSIALYLKFEMLSVLFTGDIENNTIQALQYTWDLPDNFHYIKIPHHGSSSASKLIDILERRHNPNVIGGVACSTVFRKAKLPEQKILQRYRSIFKKVICTSDIIDLSPVAIIHTRFDINSREYITKSMKLDIFNKN